MKYQLLCLMLFFILLPSKGLSCLSKKAKKVERSQIQKLLSKVQRSPNTHTPFGGSDSSKWTPEAQLANLIWDILQTRSKNPGIKQVLLGLPVQFQESDFRPYGDGQTNARASFGPHWSKSLPPFYAIREIFLNGQSKDHYIFHPDLAVSSWEEKSEGSVTLIRPKGWKEWFAVRFDSQVLPYSEFQKGLPTSFNQSQGRRFPDPENIRKESLSLGLTPLHTLLQHHFGEGYNVDPYLIDDVHGRFPHAHGQITAVSRGWTWLVDDPDKKISPFKHLYTCFSGRNFQEETKYGVPSGSGWHKIGDAAETIVNSLEEVSLPVAVGEKLALSPLHPLAYQLNGVITATLLPAGSVFVTKQGQFHWYAVTSQNEVCTEIWVHPHVPSLHNFWGFKQN